MWNLEGMRVEGIYLGEFEVCGWVELSRVKYGGGVVHTVVLDDPIEVYGRTADRVLVDHENIMRVRSR